MKKYLVSALILAFFCAIFAVSHAEENFGVTTQEPVSQSMDLVAFGEKVVHYPFDIKYPGKWYAREERQKLPDGIQPPSLFLSREPIRSASDMFQVGVTVVFVESYFIQMVPTGSQLGNMAETALIVIAWDKEKENLISGLKSVSDISEFSYKDTEINGCPALQADYVAYGKARTRVYYVKAGKDLFLFTFEAPPAEYPQYEAVFDQMRDSFAFKGDYKIVDENALVEEKLKAVSGKTPGTEGEANAGQKTGSAPAAGGAE